MITRDCIRHGILHSVLDLKHKIMTYIRLYDYNASPFAGLIATRRNESVSHLLRFQDTRSALRYLVLVE